MQTPGAKSSAVSARSRRQRPMSQSGTAWGSGVSSSRGMRATLARVPRRRQFAPLPAAGTDADSASCSTRDHPEAAMAGQQRNMEGNEEQKRAAAREAKAEGKKPSEVGATTGASKQTKKAPDNASHQEKMDLKHEGKQAGRQEK